MPSQQKKDKVAMLQKLAAEYPVVGIIDLKSMPLAQLQAMRKNLRGNVVMIGGRKRIFKLALENASKKLSGLEKLTNYLKGQPGLIFTKQNPFTLAKELNKSKTNAPAKPGSVAPKDIIVPAGPTGFAPGPIIGELGQVGIKAGIDAGKVVIKQDSLVAKEGAVIDAKLAGILGRLGITPMEIGLNLVAVYDKGEIFEKSILTVDEKQYLENITTAHSWAFNLACDAGILNKDNTDTVLAKAFSDAKALAIAQNIMAKEVMGEILAKANAEMAAVQSAANV